MCVYGVLVVKKDYFCAIKHFGMKKIILVLSLAFMGLFITSGNVKYGKNTRLTKDSMTLPYYLSSGESSVSALDFLHRADTASFWNLEDMIVDEVLSGNVPSVMKKLRKIVFTTAVVDSVEILKRPHKIEMWILPDYISIGNDKDYVRMPMGPLAAQRIADTLGCILPTTYIVDRIAEASQGHLDIFPFRPLGTRNSQPIVYQDSNNAIKALYKAYGYKYGELISGLKKDVVLTYKIHTLKGHERYVAIYGWHHPDGRVQQPLHTRHGNFYADYSHGIRMIYRTIKVDGVEYDAREILESESLYRLLSDEPMPLGQASYAGFPRY